MAEKLKKPSELSHEEWCSLYPRLTLKQIAEELKCSESNVYKWIKRAGFSLTKKNRTTRSAEHAKKISEALSGMTRKKSGTTKICRICNRNFYVIAARSNTAKYCSNQCRLTALHDDNSGEAHPKYLASVVREKRCQGCGGIFKHDNKKPITSFTLQKFCTKQCADLYGSRLKGHDHPNFKGKLARRRDRGTSHSRWATRVLQRDGYRCMRCGVSGETATLQAHHKFPFELFPDKRDDVNNGTTLCSRCHWDVHDTLDPNFIHGVERKKSNKKSLLVDGSVNEGKVFGKDSRKWKGDCYWCGELVVKRLSDVVGKKSVFCSSGCRSKHIRAFSKYRPSSPDLIPATARAPESEGLRVDR
jgi:hypothetical protein